MSNYGDDIRRISRYEKLLKLINEGKGTADQSDKGEIPGGKGVSYANGSNNKTSAGGSLPNNGGAFGSGEFSTGQGDGVSVGNQLLDGVNSQGNSGNLTNPDNTQKDGWYDLASILNGVKDVYDKGVPTTGQLINSLTGIQTDDATRDLLIHLKDAAFAFVPPDGATDAYNPGTDSLWVAGKYWVCSSPAVAYGPTPATAIDAAIAALKLAFPAPYPTGQADAYWDTGSLSFVSTGNYAFTWYQAPGVGAPPNNVNVLQGACPGPAGATASCAYIAPPPAGNWLDRLITQLAWVTPITAGLVPVAYAMAGRFIPNPFDVNVPTSYLDGASILDVKTAAGDDARIGPLRDGGWYAYYRDAGAGNAPLGAVTDASVFTIGGDRKSMGFVTPNDLLKLLP